MRKTLLKYFLPSGILFVALGVLLYFFHPLAPLFLLASLLIQAPLVWAISRASMNSSYLDRAHERREAFRENGDAAAWLQGEEAEAASLGYRYWSRRSRCLCAMNRAQALLHLGRAEEAAALLEQVEPSRLDADGRARLQELAGQLDTPAETPPEGEAIV